MIKAISNMARQGDVLLQRVDSARGTRVDPEAGREVLAHGEATGHHHSFAMSDRIARFRDDGGAGGSLFLTVSGDAPALLEHQEHSTIPVAPGNYRAIRQRVFQARMARRVSD